MSETELQAAVLKWLHWKGYFAWRQNNAGIYHPDTGKWVFHGLRGVSDILGVLPQTVSVDGQSQTFGNLLAIECKQPGKKPTPHQEAFMANVRSKGGIAFWITSLRELEENMERYPPFPLGQAPGSEPPNPES